MGFAVSYRLITRLSEMDEVKLFAAAKQLGAGRGYASCEGLRLMRLDDGWVGGSSKPNIAPHDDELAELAADGLPDTTISDIIEMLRKLSQQFSLEWEIDHDYSDGALGYIRHGEVDEAVQSFVDVLTQVGIDITTESCEQLLNGGDDFDHDDDDDDDDDSDDDEVFL